MSICTASSIPLCQSDAPGKFGGATSLGTHHQDPLSVGHALAFDNSFLVRYVMLLVQISQPMNDGQSFEIDGGDAVSCRILRLEKDFSGGPRNDTLNFSVISNPSTMRSG